MEFRFQKSKWTNKPLAQHNEFIYHNLDSGKSVAAGFLNLIMALDNVDHNPLKEKLFNNGISRATLKEISNYA